MSDEKYLESIEDLVEREKLRKELEYIKNTDLTQFIPKDDTKTKIDERMVEY